MQDGPALSSPRLIEGVRDTLLVWFKQAHNRKPWPQMNEAEQRQWIVTIEDRAERLVRDIVDHVATGNFPVVHAKVDTFQVKAGEVKIVAKGFADDKVLLTLNHAGEKAVKIIVADSDQFDQDRDTLNPDPDEPGLPGVKIEPGLEDEDDSEMYDRAVKIAQGETKIGPALLQRRLSIGYNRAVSYLERMEAGGIVTAPNEKGGRKVIQKVDPEQEEGEAILDAVKSQQYLGGRNSALGKIARDQNPFNPGSKESADWFAGWDSVTIEAEPEIEPPPEAMERPDTDAESVEPIVEPEERLEDPAPAETTKAYTDGMKAWGAGKGLDANPYSRKAQREDWEKGWLAASSENRRQTEVERPADIEPEVEIPAIVDAEPDPDGIPNQDGEVIETEEQAAAYGAWCRTDGRGTGANPFVPSSTLGKAWLRGYNERKRSELDADQF